MNINYFVMKLRYLQLPRVIIIIVVMAIKFRWLPLEGAIALEVLGWPRDRRLALQSRRWKAIPRARNQAVDHSEVAFGESRVPIH